MGNKLLTVFFLLLGNQCFLSSAMAQVDSLNPDSDLRPDLPNFIKSSHDDEAFMEAFHTSATSLDAYADKLSAGTSLLLNSREQPLRVAAHDTIRASLTRALALPQSFDYDWTKIQGLSVISDPDKSWKIYTWQQFFDDSTYIYGGIFQFADESSSTVQLEDNAQELGLEMEYELLPEQWYGAVYYGVAQFKLASGADAWILFGYDADGYLHRRKIADVLIFDRKGNPRFGSEVFKGAEDRPDHTFSRLILEYRVDSRVGLKYDEELGGIVFDHLVTGPPAIKGGPPTYIPDGSYDGYVFNPETSIWEWRMEWFDRVISSEAPRPSPILDSSSPTSSRDIFGRPKAPRKTQGVPR